MQSGNLPFGSDADGSVLVDLPGADVRLATFCTADEAGRWYARLMAEIPWERHRLRLFGREFDAPRLSCWVGDAEAVYTYSRTRFVPRPWTPALAALRETVAARCESRFNSTLCNLYRHGRDGMGWHSDDEPELGPTPCIASLSFGAARRFRLRHKHDPRYAWEAELPAGSLLIMAGETQRHYRHAVPKTAEAVGARINLTFRLIG